MEMTLSTQNRTTVAFQNKKLQNATMQIMQVVDKIRNNWFEVGAIIAQVDEQELYKDDGFNNVHEWTTRAFGIKKTMSYDLLKIGKEYTREIQSAKGRTMGYECNLMDSGSSDNFALTQVIRMLPAGHDKAKELVDAKVITPDMTSSAISKVIKSITNPEPEPVEPTEPEQPETVEPDEPLVEVSHEEWLRMTFDKITTQEIFNELKFRGYDVSELERG